MWGDDWSLIGAENIDGTNSVLWKYTDRFGGQDDFWLTIHDAQWGYYTSGNTFGEDSDAQFYRTETNFNLDLNEDGRIGPPPNNDPVLTSQKATISDGQQNRIKSIDTWDLTQGYSDPDGDFIFVEEGSLSANNGSIVFDSYQDRYNFTPDKDFTGLVNISYNIVDENGGSVNASQSFNIIAPTFKTIDSQGDIYAVTDDNNHIYVQDSQNNRTAITYWGEKCFYKYVGRWLELNRSRKY